MYLYLPPRPGFLSVISEGFENEGSVGFSSGSGTDGSQRPWGFAAFWRLSSVRCQSLHRGLLLLFQCPAGVHGGCQGGAPAISANPGAVGTGVAVATTAHCGEVPATVFSELFR